jgi:hypothetical protein
MAKDIKQELPRRQDAQLIKYSDKTMKKNQSYYISTKHIFSVSVSENTQI